MEDKWGEAFDPGGIRAEEEGRDFTGSGILSFFEDAADEYWTGRREEWDPWTAPWDYGWGDYGNMGAGSLAELAKQTWFSESLSDVEKREQKRADEGLGVATMADMEQMYGRDFAAKASPLFDPEFSLGAYEEIDPMYAGMDLFRKSRMEAA